jgi:GTP-binding protein
MGGPDGGDGGNGGDVVFIADEGVGTLLDLRHRTQWAAEDGEHGQYRLRQGAMGKDLEIRVPVGTMVYNQDEDLLLFELLSGGERRIACPGGKGGLGNRHFKSSTNRAPRQTTPGEPGRALNLRLELKLMADVGLVGFPNAGKSTLISRISAARPKIADYPFTTLTPNLGVVSMGDSGTFVVADIPGLIEGAAEGKGLGHQFLRHVERTKLFLHLVSLGAPVEDETPAVVSEVGLEEGQEEGQEESDNSDATKRAASMLARYTVLRDELRRYDAELLSRPEIIILTQSDTVSAEDAAAAKQVFPAGTLVISAVTGEGVQELVNRVWTALGELRG